VGSNGARQTILGFDTEAAARAWIAQDEQLTNAAERFRRLVLPVAQQSL
jgi:hypothetical protein